MQIQPRDFGKDLLEAITAALNEKYPNRVVPQLGLCIALYDVVAVGEAQIHPGSAAHHTHVEFRLVVFRPFVGEVLEGTIIGCDEAGLRVSMGFFDNIHVPRHLIGFAQGAVRWSPDERLWFWQVDEASQLWFDTGDPHLKENPVRFRVQEVAYSKEVNVASKEADTGRRAAGRRARRHRAPRYRGRRRRRGRARCRTDGAPKEAAPSRRADHRVHRRERPRPRLVAPPEEVAEMMRRVHVKLPRPRSQRGVACACHPCT